MNASLLAVDAIHTFYGSAHILHGVSLHVDRDECLAVLGRNGVGKTTLVRSIIGFSPPRRGSITLAGTPIHGWSSRRIVAAGVAVVPQGRRVFPALTVQENLRMSLRRTTDDPWDLDRVYALFPRLAERRRQRAGTLSGGEQQMLAVGRALMSSPELLLLDEPTEGLAPIIVETLTDSLLSLKAAGVSILLVEQRVGFVKRLADRVALMGNRGAVEFVGSTQQYEQQFGVSAAVPAPGPTHDG